MQSIKIDYDKCYQDIWFNIRHEWLGFENVQWLSKEPPIKYQAWPKEYVDSLEIDFTKPMFKIVWTGDFTWIFGYPTIRAISKGTNTSIVYPTKYKTIFVLMENQCYAIEGKEHKNSVLHISKGKFGPGNLIKSIKRLEKYSKELPPRPRPSIT